MNDCLIRMTCLIGLLAATLVLSGCASTVIGTAADAAIAVAKVPVKAGGAIVDIATGGD